MNKLLKTYNFRIFVNENFERENLEPYSPLDWKDLDFSHIKDKVKYIFCNVISFYLENRFHTGHDDSYEKKVQFRNLSNFTTIFI